MKERFAKIYEDHSDSIFRYCFLRVSDRNVAIDITQDVFMRYWNSLIQKSDISNDKAFLFTIARNAIIDWYRKKKSFSLEALQEERDEFEEFVLLPDDAHNMQELDAEARFLLDKIKELPPTAQQILYLRYIEDMKPKEIAKILKISENAVSVRIHRGIEDLRKITGYDDLIS